MLTFSQITLANVQELPAVLLLPAKLVGADRGLEDHQEAAGGIGPAQRPGRADVISQHSSVSRINLGSPCSGRTRAAHNA